MDHSEFDSRAASIETRPTKCKMTRVCFFILAAAICQAHPTPEPDYEKYFEPALASRGLSNYDDLLTHFSKIVDTFPQHQRHLIRFRFVDEQDSVSGRSTDFDEFEVLRLMPTISHMLRENLLSPSEMAVLQAVYGELWSVIEHESGYLGPAHPLYRIIAATESHLPRRFKRAPICHSSPKAAPSDRLLQCAWHLALSQPSRYSVRQTRNARTKRSFHISRDSDLVAMKAFVNFLNASADVSDDNVDYDFSTHSQSSSATPSVYELFELAVQHSRRRRVNSQQK